MSPKKKLNKHNSHNNIRKQDQTKEILELKKEKQEARDKIKFLKDENSSLL